ncbi:MAG: copper resistance protein CopB [Alphaproteobacteria bacterium]|nr:MAG: copper resistance protein CopB [Alphaproteobacteria bacterium]
MNIVKLTMLFSSFGALSLADLAYADDSSTKDDSAKVEKPWSMADKYYGKAEMAAARKAVQKAAGGGSNYFIMGDRLETQFTNGEDTFVWDAQGWYGTDENKIWIKTEGDYNLSDGSLEDAEVQALWSKPISAFWDVQAGIRYDIEPKGRTHAVLGVQGLAPYWFEVDIAAFLSTKGDVTSRIETEYDFILSQRLFLQPRAELEFSAQDINELNIRAGITNFDLGLRLRYEFKREVAPYIGVEWQKNLGETAGLVRANGGDPDKIALLIGLRTWY